MYDIAIVGSGIASSMTLCQLAKSLLNTPRGSKTLRIGVIEKDGEMWTGIPYGRRSIVGALAFQKLQEFLEEPERSCFIEWLATNADSWLGTLREQGGPGAAQWISDNESLMEQGRWGELYLPRFLFGRYVSSQVARAREVLTKAGLATVTTIRGEAIDVRRLPGGSLSLVVEEESGARAVLNAARVVLAIGSPPQKAILRRSFEEQDPHVHIHDVYAPSEDLSIQEIHRALSSLPERSMANVLILGSNASALEVLYLISYRSEIRKLLNSVVILSYSGLLPYKICEQSVGFELSSLDSLCSAARFSAAELMAAITCDIRAAEAARLNIADLRDPVGAAVSQLIALMSIEEQEKFVCEHGVHYSRMMRRAGRDTRNAADELVKLGILTTVRGRLKSLKSTSLVRGAMQAVYETEVGQAETTYPTLFNITINCGGFEELDRSSSRLINSLVDNRLCSINRTGRGFLINERLEASENVYVIGPLVGGNFNRKIRFWHVESASRIVGLAKLLAESLSESFSTQFTVLSQAERVSLSASPPA